VNADEANDTIDPPTTTSAGTERAAKAKRGNAESGAGNALGKPGAGEPQARIDEGRLGTESDLGNAEPAERVRGQRRTTPPRVSLLLCTRGALNAHRGSNGSCSPKLSVSTPGQCAGTRVCSPTPRSRIVDRVRLKPFLPSGIGPLSTYM
jgi:hypothetical protein